MSKNNYYVIVPVYNEQKHIRSLLNNVHKYTKNIIVVNDGSSDNTQQILENIPFVTTVCLYKNQGKGAAMKAGTELAWKKNASAIIFMDGDNQHNPLFLPTFFKLLDEGNDFVIGVRILKTTVPLYRKLGNILLMSAVKLLFNISLEDLLCGYRGMTKKGYKKILWTSMGYGVETEMIANIGMQNLKYQTVVVDTTYIDKYKGFSVKDGLLILILLPFWRFFKLKR